MSVAIIETFKQESMYGLPIKTKKETEVAVVKRWSLVETCLYKFLPDIMIINIQELFISKMWDIVQRQTITCSSAHKIHIGEDRIKEESVRQCL